MTLILATSPLLKMFYSAFVAGVGVAFVFSVAIFGAVRSSDLRRCGRSRAAAGCAALAACAFAASAAVVVYGLILVAQKS
jgi:hypothetical protein